MDLELEFDDRDYQILSLPDIKKIDMPEGCDRVFTPGEVLNISYRENRDNQ